MIPRRPVAQVQPNAVSRSGLLRSRLRAATPPSEPSSWAATDSGSEPSAIPAKDSVMARATVTEGLANEVEALNQYAAVIWAATAQGS